MLAVCGNSHPWLRSDIRKLALHSIVRCRKRHDTEIQIRVILAPCGDTPCALNDKRRLILCKQCAGLRCLDGNGIRMEAALFHQRIIEIKGTLHCLGIQRILPIHQNHLGYVAALAAIQAGQGAKRQLQTVRLCAAVDDSKILAISGVAYLPAHVDKLAAGFRELALIDARLF